MKNKLSAIIAAAIAGVFSLTIVLGATLRYKPVDDKVDETPIVEAEGETPTEETPTEETPTEETPTEETPAEETPAEETPAEETTEETPEVTE